MSNMIELKVPDIGGHENVDVIEVMVSVGDQVDVEQSLITLETDKATMEVPASHAGVVKEVRIKVGDKVSEGTIVVVVEAAASAAAPAPAAAAPAAAPAVAAAPAPVATAAPAAAAVIEVHVPDIGNFDAVEVIEVNVKVGDTVGIDDSLITLESDKASMEVPSTAAGVVESIAIKVGDKVAQGALILTVKGSATAAAPAAVAAPAPVAAAAPAALAAPAAAVAAPVAAAPAAAKINDEAFVRAHASPSVRRFARELGVDLSKVAGKGAKGRILHEDVQAYVKAVMNGTAAAPVVAAAAAVGVSAGGLDLLPWPKVDFAKFGAVEVKPLSRIKKISGANPNLTFIMLPTIVATKFKIAHISRLQRKRGKWNEMRVQAKMREPVSGWYWHGWDESASQSWAQPQTGLSAQVWARGVGWLGMALVDTLEFMPKEQTQLRAPLEQMVQQLAVTLLASRDSKSGVWLQLPLQPGLAGNYAESSASSMFVYFLTKAQNLGLLEKRYQAATLDAYQALLNQFVLVDASGTAHLTQMVQVAGLGFGRDGSAAYYLNEPVIRDDAKGVGPFIMAGVQVAKLLGL